MPQAAPGFDIDNQKAKEESPSHLNCHVEDDYSVKIRIETTRLEISNLFIIRTSFKTVIGHIYSLRGQKQSLSVSLMGLCQLEMVALVPDIASCVVIRKKHLQLAKTTYITSSIVLYLFGGTLFD